MHLVVKLINRAIYLTRYFYTTRCSLLYILFSRTNPLYEDNILEEDLHHKKVLSSGDKTNATNSSSSGYSSNRVNNQHATMNNGKKKKAELLQFETKYEICYTEPKNGLIFFGSV